MRRSNEQKTQQVELCVANSRDATANRLVDRVVKQLAKSKFEILKHNFETYFDKKEFY